MTTRNTTHAQGTRKNPFATTEFIDEGPDLTHPVEYGTDVPEFAAFTTAEHVRDFVTGQAYQLDKQLDADGTATTYLMPRNIVRALQAVDKAGEPGELDAALKHLDRLTFSAPARVRRVVNAALEYWNNGGRQEDMGMHATRASSGRIAVEGADEALRALARRVYA